jgi:hypothetical protein
MKMLLGTVGLAALVLNPYACSSTRELTYGADDMRAAIEGTWHLATSRGSYTFQIEQAGATTTETSQASLIPSAHACGKRTLVKSAHACVDTTTMPLVVKYAGETTEGSFVVDGHTFESGRLAMDIDGQVIGVRISKYGFPLDITDGSVLVRTRR